MPVPAVVSPISASDQAWVPALSPAGPCPLTLTPVLAYVLDDLCFSHHSALLLPQDPLFLPTLCRCTLFCLEFIVYASCCEFQRRRGEWGGGDDKTPLIDIKKLKLGEEGGDRQFT